MWTRFVPAVCLCTVMLAAYATVCEGGERQRGVESRHQVVIHMNSGDEQMQRGALNNIKHLYQELGGDGVKVELVVHGAGLKLFMKRETKLGEELERLYGQYGVSYTAGFERQYFGSHGSGAEEGHDRPLNVCQPRVSRAAKGRP